MKHEWRKHEKELYSTKKKPTILTVPKQKYIMIKGKGNPNNEDFSRKIGVLMSIAYPIKMNYKRFCKNNLEIDEEFHCTDYTVYPLEGLWTKEKENSNNKDDFIYTIMVRQPDFISEEMFDEAIKTVKKKKPDDLLEEVSFGEIEDGLCVQMLHIGSYDSEDNTFKLMDELVKEGGYIRSDSYHREIYLSDARRVESNKLKTILRYKIKKK
ncbi:GyrI-like domain-containing protein [Anaerosphaera multitolerans]|uniref:Small molecule-binding protein n=1 Tax=Anaerosphaera multitolerans TaxID=2487351 RepID=A0A437S5L9_9FIRM|nr:GyrI-like domain-containing protein [Anaerosphaera multitolerans]RVU54206.1 small molecule-binding protein [Anaerosphaera multitolerans]